MIAEFGTLVIYTIIIWFVFAFIYEITGVVVREYTNIRKWFAEHKKCKSKDKHQNAKK